MTADLLIVLGLLAAALVMFAVNRPRMDAVALLMLTALPLTGVISVEEALAGFGDPSIVLIAALFVIGEGLVRTGIAQRLGDWLVTRAGRSETRLVALLMVVTAGIGSVMSSTGVVAIFVPVALRIARNARIPAGRIMMPLSAAGLLSGMMTLIGTPPNLVIQGELVRRGLEGFHFFAFTPFGLVLLGLTVGYMLLARHWLARPGAETATAPPRPDLATWIADYALAGREHRLRLRPGSPLVGRRLEELDLRATQGVNIIAIERGGRLGRRLVRPLAQTRLEAGDVLFLDLLEPSIDLAALGRRFGLEELPLSRDYFADQRQEIGMAEAMVPADSKLAGRTVVEARFRSEYELAVIGLKRGRSAHEGSLLDEPLRAGDTLLLVGPWRAIRRLQGETGDLVLLNLPAEFDEVVPAASRAPHALLALGVMVVLMVTGLVANVQAALIGCLLMGLFGCVDMPSAYRSIHWPSLVLIVGMLPFALALQKTGGIDLAVQTLLGTIGEGSPRLVLAGLFVATAVAGLLISNTATAVLMAPVALAMAEQLGASPYPFAMTTALAASAAFMTPVSSPVNTLVVGPGNYSFFDFVRVGVPLALLTLVVTVTLVPVLLPF